MPRGLVLPISKYGDDALIRNDQGIISLFFRILLRIPADIDGYLSWAASRIFHSEYRVIGTCQRRGVCCRNLAVRLSPSFWRWPLLRRLLIVWYRGVYRFAATREDPTSQVVVFACGYLQGDRCSIYRWRPVMCRRYPQPRYFGKPTFLPGCGYQATKRRG